MRPVLALALVLAHASFVVSACGGGGGGNGPGAADPKPVDLSRYLPGVFETDKAGSGDPRIAHVRVWTDVAVRVAPKWKDDLVDQIDYANQLLQPMLGVRLQIDAWKEWDRTGDLHQALAQLAAVDAGSDVAWVIGYTGPNDVATRAMSELGDARVLGHDIVIHGWADKPETDLVALSLPAEMSDAQRQEVIGAHRRHKQAAVLLHMLAITCGAVSTQDPSWLDNPLYSTKQITFPDRTRELMSLAINDRLSGGTDQTLAPKLLELLDREWGGWVAADREQVMAALKHVADVAHAGETASDVPADAYPQYERIKTLRKSDPHQALVELDNLLGAYPGNATLYLLKCDIMLDKPGVKSRETRLACAHVSDIAPGDPSPHIHLALKLVEAGDVPSARTELSLAETQVANLEHGTDEAWHGIIDAYMAIGSLTWAEEALARSKLTNDPIAAKIAQTRSRYGVPRGTKLVTPDHEIDLVAAARNALNLIYANKHADARALLAKAEAKWHDAPGLLAARCDLALRDGDTDGARALCARAVQIQPDESWALYLGGVIALKDTSAGAAQTGITLLKKAIAADPDLAQPWHALGQAYQRIHDQAAFDKLNTDYATRFQQNLPQ